MANTLNAQGLSQFSGAGSAPTYEQVRMAIKNGSTTAVFFGDPVVQATGTTGLGTGYITQYPTAPQALTISGFALANGLVTATFTSTTAPQVGGRLVLNGLTTATTLNGSWPIVAATATTVVFPYPGGAVTTQTTTGYVFVPVAGVFVGCSYLSVAQKKTVWLNYWPGTSDSNSDITAYVISDTNARFSIQTANSNTTASAVGIAAIGQNIGLNYVNSGGSQTNGNTATGLSTFFADQYTLAANFPTGQYGQAYMPFTVVGLQNASISGASSPFIGWNGWDPSTAFNNVIVAFNNSSFTQLSGI